MALKIWEKISEKIVYANRYWTYKLDKFRIGNSEELEYHYVHTLGSTMVIPFISDDRLLMINQYRYLNGMESLEFPCGSVEAGITPEENALKELREETGYSAQKIVKIGFFAPYTGASDEICTVYAAFGLFYSPLEKDITEDFEPVELSVDELNEKIKNNSIWDGLTLSAWSLAGNRNFSELK